MNLTLSLDLRQSLDSAYSSNVVDETCLRFLRNCAEKVRFFVDLGANQGLYSCVVLHEFPTVRVIAVEPDSYSFEKFERNIELNDLDGERLTLLQIAASDQEGESELMINTAGNRAGSSLIIDQRSWTGLEENVVLKVQVRTLRDIVSPLEVSNDWLLKMDIEGMEFKVLSAFLSSMPRNSWPKFIILEALGHTISTGGGSPISLVIRSGYELVDHDGMNFCFALSA